MGTEIKEALILRVQPGDVLVLRFEKSLSDGERDMIRKTWAKQFPNNVVLVFDGTGQIDISVVRDASESAQLTEIARESFKKAQG